MIREYRPPLNLGTFVKPYGKIAAISFRDGERYYILVDKRGGVALMPADVIEGNKQ